jgi:hypothetical protein
MNLRILQGLFWRDWLLHKGELSWIFSAWLFGVWVVPLPPAYFLLPFGVISACLLGPSLGGADAEEASEEFSFALPPSRAQRYLVRLTLGAGALLVLMAGGVLAAIFDLPQALWGLIFEGGYTHPFDHSDAPFLYGLALTGTVAVFSECFAAGASSRSPHGMGWIWLRGLVVAVIVGVAGCFGEALLHPDHPTGLISSPFLGAWGLLRIFLSYRDYGRKEGVSGLPPLVSLGQPGKES